MKNLKIFMILISVFGVALLLFFIFKNNNKSTIDLHDLLNMSNKPSLSKEDETNPAIANKVVDGNNKSSNDKSLNNYSSSNGKISNNMKNIYDTEIPYDYDYSSTSPISYEKIDAEKMDSEMRSWFNKNIDTSSIFEKKHNGYTYLLITKNKEINKSNILIDNIKEKDNYVSVSFKTKYFSELLKNSSNYLLIRINKQKDVKVDEIEIKKPFKTKPLAYSVVTNSSKEFNGKLKKWTNVKRKKFGTYQIILNNKRFFLISMGRQSLIGNYLDISNIKSDSSKIYIKYIENVNNIPVDVKDGTDRKIKTRVKYYPYILLELSDLKKEIVVSRK